MKIYHNSQKQEFKKPFGAIPTEGAVQFSVETDERPEKMFLRLWNEGESLVEMDYAGEKDGLFLHSCSMHMPKEPCLLWYHFVAEIDGKRVFCVRGKGNEGEVLSYEKNSSWQITVYDKEFRTPDWLKNSVMYQIFPDRFFRKGEFREIPFRKSEYIIHEDWYEPISFNQHPFEKGPACNDFFGGNIQGIIEKLPYLTALGIGVLYLNPIFEAFSNHRYDTGDYSKIDQCLGTEEDYVELCEKCRERGIRIILDGVFSHTGSDSIYFNKYGTYGENVGAYKNANSPYRAWYQWSDGREEYHSWWGCRNLPNINELEPTYIDYILQRDDAIIKKWLRLGADGWRLDVADELPDEFIKILRKEVKAQKPDAAIIGEVWEDASNKESYGVKREYLLGAELDSVMNYPFRNSVFAFICGDIDAEGFSDEVMTIAEHYPFQALYSAMNIIGTHDTARAKSVFGAKETGENMTIEERRDFRLDANQEDLAIKRLKLAVFLQMTFVGVPCVYYGDEIGMQGLKDPFNRMPFSWRCVDVELLEYYKKLIYLRNSMPCLRTGSFEIVFARDGVFGFERKIENGRDVFGNKAKNGTAICFVNRNTEAEEVVISVGKGGKLTDVISGEKAELKDGTAKFCIPPFGVRLFARIENSEGKK